MYQRERYKTPERDLTGLENLEDSPLPLSSLPPSPDGNSDRYSGPETSDSESTSRAHSPPPQLTISQQALPNSSPISSIIASSPVIGSTRQEKADSRARKRRKKRQMEKEAAIQEKKARAIAAEEEEKKRQEKKQEEHRTSCRETLSFMATKGISFGDLVLYVSDPTMKEGEARWSGFFGVPNRVATVLNFWVSSRNSNAARTAIHEWTLGYVSDVLNREGEDVTRSGLLRSEDKIVNKTYTVDFSLSSLYEKIKILAPSTTRLLHAFSTTRRQQVRSKLEVTAEVPEEPEQSSAELSTKKQTFVACSLVTLLGARSQKNSYARHVLGLYLYSTGAQRQVFSVLSHLGISSSYPALAGSHRSRDSKDEDIIDSEEMTRDSLEEASSSDSELRQSEELPVVEEEESKGRGEKKPGRRDGLLRQLSQSCREEARTAAKDNLLSVVYDNVNPIFKASEQILGRKDSQENGTCATAFPLFDASVDDLKVSDLLNSADIAPPLKKQDILLTSEENQDLRDRLVHTVLRIIVTFGGLRFARFQTDVDTTLPQTPDKIKLHKTTILPLPAFEIDESSTTGNAEVLEAIFAELSIDRTSEIFKRVIRIIWGDQLSVARVRSVTLNRVGHDSASNSYLDVVCGPGIFHYQIAATGAILETHWGDPHSSTRNPGSLCFHNTVLDRKPISISSLPPYRTCRDLTFVSLYARVLHCLQLVSGEPNLDQYATDVSWEELQGHAQQIVDQFANPERANELRNAREHELSARPVNTDTDTNPDPPSSGDMVFENAVYFLRDALCLREFTDAIKGGDSGRMLTILKVFALAYRGAGRTKYAHELLHLLHNLTHVWPKSLRNIVMRNWLVNPTGKANSWVPVDLLQEHMNFWIKTFYKAHGSNASWEWLETIGPCVDILRQLATQINTDLGSRQGSKHATPDLTRDINELIKSLREHRVYEVEHGRIIEGDAPTVPNIISAGLSALPTPLREYNDAFRKLQERRRMTPLIGTPAARHRELSPHVQAHSPILAAASGPRDHLSTRDLIDDPPAILYDVEDDDSSESEAEEDEKEVGYGDRDNELLARESEEDVELYID